MHKYISHLISRPMSYPDACRRLSYFPYITARAEVHLTSVMCIEFWPKIANKRFMEFVLQKTIALVGMMGAGKTAVGKALAARLDVPFLDSDAEIEAAANRKIAEIFERDGEPFFRQKESLVIDRLLEGNPCVLSTGGGAFLADHNRAMMTQKGVSVWLDADVSVLWGRVKHKDTRPLLRTPDPFQTLKDLHEKRAPIYQLADIAVPSLEAYSIDDMTDHVITALLKRPDVLRTK